MRRITAVLASACLALALAGAAASTTFGVADDAGKYAEDGGAGFFTMLTQLGMTENRMAVFWDPSQPSTIVDQAFLDRAVPEAQRRGIDVMFAIYPLKAKALAETPNGIQLFAQYAAKVAERYPYVRKIICLIEGNQPRYQQPQFDDQGNGISGYVQEQAMAACYDALKDVDPGIDVIAFGLSPRGNDDFDAPSNVSHSPIRFLKEVGDAYRQSGRTKPIADDLSVHCYPNVNTDAPSVGYLWPKMGCVNLDRLKQAWWDAVHANQSCHGKTAEWHHVENVTGARATFKTLPRSFVVRADEGFTYEVKITRPSSTRRLTGADGAGEAARDVLFKLPKLAKGRYTVRIILRAETNPSRASIFSHTFNG